MLAVPEPSCSLWSWLHSDFLTFPFSAISQVLQKEFSHQEVVHHIFPGHFCPVDTWSSIYIVVIAPPKETIVKWNHHKLCLGHLTYWTSWLTRKLYRTLTLATVGQNHPTITYFIMRCWLLYWKWKAEQLSGYRWGIWSLIVLRECVSTILKLRNHSD